MRPSRIKQKLAGGQPVCVFAPEHTSASLVEAVGDYGFDGIFIDMEHGPAGWEDVEHMIRAAELANCDAIVRVDENHGPTIGRALDRGAVGVQIPHVTSLEEAKAAVRHAKYAPLGTRGIGRTRARRGTPDSEYTLLANDESMVIVMIEEVKALASLDKILAVDGIDVFLIGAADLSQSMGYRGQVDHPEVQQEVESAIRRTRAAGRTPGAQVGPHSIEHFLDIGTMYLTVALTTLLRSSVEQYLGAVRTWRDA